MTKPFGTEELLACARWCGISCRVMASVLCFRSGELSIDLVRRIVKVSDKEVKRSPTEYDLLPVPVQHASKVLHEFWDESTDSHYLRVYLRRLCQKLIEADLERPQYCLTGPASAIARG